MIRSGRSMPAVRSIRSVRILWVLLGVMFLIIYFLFDPLESTWMPQCVFHRLTGLQCMGCGSQRVVHSLLHGDFERAWQSNAFLVCSLPFILFLIFTEFNRRHFPVLYRRVHSRTTIIITAAMLLTWLPVRNYLGI